MRRPVRFTMASSPLTLLLVVLLRTAALAWPTVYPTGTTLYDPQKTFNGYTLFAPVVPFQPRLPSYTLYLINMQGTVVHRWELPFAPLQGHLLSNGHVVVMGQNDKQAAGRPGAAPYFIGGAAGWLVELTWEGEKVFEYEDLNMHHDFVRLPNGHYVYLAWEPMPKSLRVRIRGGLEDSEFPDGTMFSDYLVEIDGQGRQVWKWRAQEHLNPDIDIIGPLYQRNEWMHTNSVGVLEDGNLVITSRSLDSMMVIDKQSGKIISRWGNTTHLDKKTGQLAYRSGASTLGGPHGTCLIPPGLPGAGHLLCYDNGLYANASRWVEVDRAAGRLVRQSPHTTGRKHFSDFAGGVQRLPNGNTLVCDGGNGRIMQTTLEGKIVWEYINPYSPTPNPRGALFKVYLYAPEYCPQFKALAPAGGTDVTPAVGSQLQAAEVRRTGEVPLFALALGIATSLSFLLGWGLAHQRRTP